MNHIPHSTFDDEARFIVTISDFIKKGELPLLPQWESSTRDEKAKMVRKKQAGKEAAEAEALAKELGVWDEFYGSGKPGSSRKSKGKGKGKQTHADGEEDTSALQALIMKKRKNMDSFFDNLAAKYTEPEKKKKKGKKRAKAPEEDEEEEVLEASPKKRSRKEVPPPPDIGDAEFEEIQQRLLEGKAKREPNVGAKATAKGRAAKGKKGK